MKRVFNRKEICKEEIGHINCDDEMVETTIAGLMLRDFPNGADFKFNYPDDDKIVVEVKEK